MHDLHIEIVTRVWFMVRMCVYTSAVKSIRVFTPTHVPLSRIVTCTTRTMMRYLLEIQFIVQMHVLIEITYYPFK